MAFDRTEFRYTPDKRSFYLKKADGIDVYYTDDSETDFMVYGVFYRLNESIPYRRIKTLFRDFDDMKDFIDGLRDFYSDSKRGFSLHHVV